MMSDQFLWVEKYRPKKVEDIILPSSLKKQFSSFLDKGEIPNLILSGSAGIGKTTIAKAILEEINADYIVVNGSMNGNIDDLRDEIKNYATSSSFTSGRKYVILDEADYLNKQSFQPALRNFMEEYSFNCGFILTCNFPHRIIEPLHSRCTHIEFKISKSESSAMAKQFFNRIKTILSQEKVEFDPKVIAEFIKIHYPDWRKIINELQSYGMSGKIDSGILSKGSDMEMETLVGFLKKKDFTEMRKWVAVNEIEFKIVVRKLYDKLYDFLEKNSIPRIVIILADYQYKNAFAIDPEINLVAMLTEIMIEAEFK